MRALVAAALLAFTLPGLAFADEGLWTFDNVPTAKIKAALGVDITPAWLAKVQAAAVRLSIGCSASVVSGDGLTLTNNHCVTDCTHDITPAGAAYRTTGFLAAKREDEQTCPGMEADILLSITDVTGRISAAGAGLTGAALVKTRNAAVSDIAAEVCGPDKRLLCQVVDLYQGGQFKLYKYRKYTDVRLVFAPGDQAAFFGGDPDNFNFPRFNLDCAFLRLYEDGKPVATPDHLRFNPAPPTVGEPVFTAGNPGQTFRDQAVSQLETQRDVSLPTNVALLSELRGRMIAFGETGPDNKRLADEALDELENEFKVVRGRLLALDDPAMMAAKRAAEAELETRAKATLEPDLGDPWADLAAIQPAAKALYLPNRFVAGGPDSALFEYARSLVRAAAERAKPSASRLPDYADNRLPGLEKELLDARPIEPALERINLEFWLAKVREYLGADDPDTRLLLGKESPEGLADRLAGSSRLGDAAVRKQLWDGGMAAIAASNDPMIQFALKIDPEARRLHEAYEEQVGGPTAKATQAIARARFRIYGDSPYPDGTFTLRLSYGAVAGWTYQGKTIPPFATFAGLFDRATGAEPFDADPRWLAAQGQLTPDTVFNFVTTNDIIGGNSGSPLLNAKAEVIGAAFDGNIHSLAGDYWFDPALNRTVVVSSAAIAEALKKIYGADALLAELAGG